MFPWEPKRPDIRTMPSDLDWRPVMYVGTADPDWNSLGILPYSRPSVSSSAANG